MFKITASSVSHLHRMDTSEATVNGTYISPYRTAAYHKNGLDNKHLNHNDECGGGDPDASNKKAGRGFETFVMTGEMIIRTTSKSPQHKQESKLPKCNATTHESPKPSRIPKPSTPKASPKTTPMASPKTTPKTHPKTRPTDSILITFPCTIGPSIKSGVVKRNPTKTKT